MKLRALQALVTRETEQIMETGSGDTPESLRAYTWTLRGLDARREGQFIIF